MRERIITVLLHAWGGPFCLDFIQPLFKNPPRRGKSAPAGIGCRWNRKRAVPVPRKISRV